MIRYLSKLLILTLTLVGFSVGHTVAEDIRDKKIQQLETLLEAYIEENRELKQRLKENEPVLQDSTSSLNAATSKKSIDSKPSNPNCEQNPSKCNEKQLCELASTRVIGVKRAWKSGTFQKFVDEAKSRNFNCRVTYEQQNVSQNKENKDTEEKARLAADAEAKRKEAEEKARLAAEAEAQRKAEEEARLAVDAEVKRIVAEEKARLAPEAVEVEQKATVTSSKITNNTAKKKISVTTPGPTTEKKLRFESDISCKTPARLSSAKGFLWSGMTSPFLPGVSYDIQVEGTIQSKNMSITLESSKVIVYQIITNTYGNKYRVTEKIVFKGVGVIKDETYTLVECN